jgi:hypothetical protein
VVNDIRLLSPEEQVHTIIETFRYKLYYTRFISFTYCIDILLENPEGVKPVLFRYLKELNPPLDKDRSDTSYAIIYYLIWREFYNLFSREEEELLVEIYQEKLDYYLRTYKWVDGEVYSLDSSIIFLKQVRLYHY